MDEEKKKGGALKIVVTVIITFIFTSLLIIGGGAWYVYKNNPYNIQACVISSFLGVSSTSLKDKAADTAAAVGDKVQDAAAAAYDHPLLNDAQEQMLESAGINPATLPQTISPEMEECFTEALGTDRVKEIIGGATPSAFDLFKAKSCL